MPSGKRLGDRKLMTSGFPAISDEIWRRMKRRIVMGQVVRECLDECIAMVKF